MRISPAALALIVSVIAAGAEQLGERKEFAVHLPTLSPAFRDAQNPGSLDEVFISWGGAKEGWAIGPLDDRYVRDTKYKSLEHLHKELPTQAHLITDFEADQLSKVCHALTRTLSVLEKDLHRKNWARLRYLDAHFSFFLRGFYFLYNAAKASRDGLADGARIPESVWDEDLRSPKTDRRIAAWRDEPERAIRLRIAARELIHQIELWQERELTNKNRDVWEDYSRDFRKAYELFIRHYFGRYRKGEG